MENDDTLAETSLGTFLDDLGSKTPAPGGGAAAAVAGSIGVNLLLMACRYSAGNGDDRRDGFAQYIETLEDLSGRFLELAEDDRRTYSEYRSHATKSGKKHERRAADLLLVSTSIPLEMGSCCRDALAGYVVHRSDLKPSFQSDVHTAVRLLRNTWHAAEELCRWNLTELDREPARSEMCDELDQLTDEIEAVFKQIDVD